MGNYYRAAQGFVVDEFLATLEIAVGRPVEPITSEEAAELLAAVGGPLVGHEIVIEVAPEPEPEVVAEPVAEEPVEEPAPAKPKSKKDAAAS